MVNFQVQMAETVPQNVSDETEANALEDGATNKVVSPSGSVDDTSRRGVIHFANIPVGWTRANVIRYFEEFGEVTRVFLKKKESSGVASARKRQRVLFSEGWIEFRKRKDARRVALLLDGQEVKGGKCGRSSGTRMMLSYMRGFEFGSLYEEVMEGRRSREARLQAQYARLRKESQLYMDLLEGKHQQNQLKKRIALKKEGEREKRHRDGTDGEVTPHDVPSGAISQSKSKYQRIDFTQNQVKVARDKAKPDVSVCSGSVSKSLLEMIAA